MAEEGSSVGQFFKCLSGQLWPGAHHIPEPVAPRWAPAGQARATGLDYVLQGRHKGLGKGLGGRPCGHTWAAQPLWGSRRWRQSQAGWPTAGRPPHPPPQRPLGSDPPSGSVAGKRQRNRLHGTPEPADQSSQGAAAGGWEAEMWPVPTGCPQRKEVGRWWASWAS